MSKFISNIANKGAKLNNLLQMSGSGFASIYGARRNLVTGGDNFRPIEFTKIRDSQEIDVTGLSQKLRTRYPSGVKMNLDDLKVLRVNNEDLKRTKEDEFGQIVITTLEDDVLIRYGDKGVAPSKDTTPKDLLKYNFIIPQKSFGVLDVQEHVPFLIETKKSERVLALAACQLSRIPTHQENITNYHFDRICQLNENDAKTLAIGFQKKLFSNKEVESFFKEKTAILFRPTEYNRSSGSLLNFDIINVDKMKDEDSTDMHYTYGERSFLIITNNKPASVTLNFCGVEESPDTRKDCEVHLDFPNNSISILNFPPYVHRKFRGEFVCIETHPREGENFIETFKPKPNPSFLGMATVFSKADESQTEWSLTFPDGDEKTKSTSFKKSR